MPNLNIFGPHLSRMAFPHLPVDTVRPSHFPVTLALTALCGEGEKKSLCCEHSLTFPDISWTNYTTNN